DVGHGLPAHRPAAARSCPNGRLNIRFRVTVMGRSESFDIVLDGLVTCPSGAIALESRSKPARPHFAPVEASTTLSFSASGRRCERGALVEQGPLGLGSRRMDRHARSPP